MKTNIFIIDGTDYHAHTFTKAVDRVSKLQSIDCSLRMDPEQFTLENILPQKPHVIILLHCHDNIKEKVLAEYKGAKLLLVTPKPTEKQLQDYDNVFIYDCETLLKLQEKVTMWLYNNLEI